MTTVVTVFRPKTIYIVALVYKDTIESIGVERAYAKISQAKVILLLVDALIDFKGILQSVEEIKKNLTNDQTLIVLVNKEDKTDKEHINLILSNLNTTFPSIYSIAISAKAGHTIDLRYAYKNWTTWST